MRSLRVLAIVMLLILLQAGRLIAASPLPITIGGVLEGGVISLLDEGDIDLAALATLRLKADLPLSERVFARAEGALFGIAVPDEVVGSAITLVPELARDPSRRAGGSLERLYLRGDSGPVQWTVGRQRISWGGGTAFAPADYFNSINPLDPEGPRAGVDGVALRYSLGPLAYVTVAGAHVERNIGPVTESGFSSGLRAGTHVGTTDLSASYGYDAPAGERVAAVEAKGDLGVGWHTVVVQRAADSGSTRGAGLAGVDYSFADGMWLANLEYQFEEGLGGAADQRMWYLGLSHIPDEVSSYSVSALVAPDTDSRTLVARYTRQLTSTLDLDARAVIPVGRVDPLLRSGMAQLKLRHSF